VNLPEFGVRKPVMTAMLFIVVIILGLVSLTRLGIDIMPEIEIPTVSVITSYQGAGPREVESRVTEVLEERLSTVSNLDRIESISQEGISSVNLKFDWGINLDEATNDVRDKVDFAQAFLPEDVDDPIIFRFDFSMMPILVLGVTARESYPILQDLLDERVVDPLKTVPGVATALIWGGLEREILVEVNRTRLEAYHLSVDQVIDALKRENLSLPGGHLKTGKMDYLIRTPEELEIPEIGNIIVATRDGTPIYLKDVAEVRDTFKEETAKVQVNRRPGLNLIVQKQSGANTVRVTERVLKKLEELKGNLPPDVEINVVRNMSEFIRLSIAILRNALFWGGLFVILVVLFFLRNLRGSLIIACAIPTSLIITFVLMYLADYTLNWISLTSLAIAIGLVVDGAIVILDNIYRHRELGERPSEAAIFGSSEVGKAVIASCLTTVAIFLPLIFIKGVVGIMFKQMAFVIILALLASLATALILIPMLSSKLLHPRSSLRDGIHPGKEEKSPLRRLYKRSERWFGIVEERYKVLLGWALENRKKVILGGAALLLSSLLLLPLVGTRFMPEQDAGLFRTDIELPVGTRMEETGKVMKAIGKIFSREVPETEASFARWGYQEAGFRSPIIRDEGSHIGMAVTKLVPIRERKRSSREIVESLRPLLTSFPGAEVRFSTEDPMAGLLLGGGKPLTIEVWGYDLDVGRGLARKVTNIIEGIEGVTDVEISRKEGKPELQIVVDREKASRLGLNVSAIGNTIKTLVSGKEATQYRERGREYDISVRLREEDRSQIDDLEKIFVTSSSGKQIRLSNVASIREEIGPVKIERRDQQRIIKVMGNIYGQDLRSIVREAKEKLERLTIPSNFFIRFSGEKEEQEKSFRNLLFALILGIILVYMVMASQFESLRDPFIILFSLPFAMIGVIWALLITNQIFTVDAFIGLIMLVGIVVNNAIVLISYINILRRRGYTVREAVTIGGRTRLRPVLMTTITTVFGLLPLALLRGEGSEFWRPFGITIIGGLIVSTLITLVFIPTLYSIFEERRKKLIR